MSLRDETISANPEFTWLEAGNTTQVGTFMIERGWLEPGEEIISCEPAGEGNMNLTLRINTKRRDLVLKQARPWVEKYDHISAPWDRALLEIEFYQRVASLLEVRDRMPRLLGSDTASRCLVLEYIAGAGDYTDLYDRDHHLDTDTLEQAARFLAALHTGTRSDPRPPFSNSEMRELNRMHIFEVPLGANSGVDLEALEPGLAKAALALRNDLDYRTFISETERDYLAEGPFLLHGDFIPGSWLRSKRGLVVIDPEFCFFGSVEIDLGCVIAHLALANQSRNQVIDFLEGYREAAPEIELEDRSISRFASAEVMRRLIGVAQLPLAKLGGNDLFRAPLLERSRHAMLEGRWGDLFPAAAN
jgi:5-methylthioribose kinase